VVSLLAAAVIAPTPKALLAGLLQAPIASSELPLGFSRPRAARQPLQANGITYHAVGQVAVALRGPDREDAFAYEVFKTRRDALADLHHPDLRHGVRLVGSVPGIENAILLRASSGGAVIADAVTVVDNVLVQAVTSSARGNPAGAIALLKAAIAHLKKVERR
jgi:hypothetical protein